MNSGRERSHWNPPYLRAVVRSKTPRFKISGKGLKEGFAHSQNMIFLQVPRAQGPGVPDFLDTTSFIFDGPSKARVDFHHVHTPKYHCLYVGYVVTEPGIYFIHIYYAGFPVGGTPFWVQIRGVEDASKASKVRVRGEALKIMREGEESAFKISTKYSGDGALAVCITGPCRVRMSSTSIGSCTKISFTPLQPGYYFISIKFNDFHVPGSPFRSECHCLCDARSSDGPPLPADNGIRKRQWVFV